MTGRPLLLLDIDGTLLPLAPVPGGAALEYGGMQLPYRPSVLETLRYLVWAGCEICWLTTWEAELSADLGRLLSLPPFEGPEQWVSRPNWKMHAALNIARSRRPPAWVWADDWMEDDIMEIVRARHPEALLIAPDGDEGLTDEHMTQIEAWLLPVQEVLGRLVIHLGSTLVAPLTSSLPDSSVPGRRRTVDRGPDEPASKLVRTAHRALTLVAHEGGDQSAQAWFSSTDAFLGEAPSAALRRGRLDAVLEAARAFTKSK